MRSPGLFLYDMSEKRSESTFLDWYICSTNFPRTGCSHIIKCDEMKKAAYYQPLSVYIKREAKEYIARITKIEEENIIAVDVRKRLQAVFEVLDQDELKEFSRQIRRRRLLLANKSMCRASHIIRWRRPGTIPRTYTASEMA